ncbi:hypothetical protein VM1G_07540 [Cytospora mali]|uniref:Uncharacterized protein n=1 Tax=Cytospora mali TaxID=578113 RepID=A0A194W8D3_CYTMA|nr:hypothetical protein VM1G_07540 [Valsa mali]
MPIFKVRPEQPALPLRSSSVPPMHLHSPQTTHNLSPETVLLSVEEHSTLKKPSKSNAFTWSHLPPHIQQRILVHALIPDGPGTPIVIGLSEHRAHLNTTAVPIFLALGSWEAYINAASIFYQHIHVNLSLFSGTAMAFLTSPIAIRPRSLVSKVQLHFTIKENLLLFDTGYTVSQSRGKLIKMNIPTALRSMRTHGRLREVEFEILKGLSAGSKNRREGAVPGYYFPMAKIQLASLTIPVVEESDELRVSSKTSMSEHAAQVIVAPAFLACRAFQSGLLPLLEDGGFEKTKLSLETMVDTDADTAMDDTSTAAHLVYGKTFVQYWLGATVVELLDISPADHTWADPFPLIRESDEIMTDLVEPETLPGDDVAASREARYGLDSSPIKYPSSTSGSDTASSMEVVIDMDTLGDDTRREERASSEDSNASEEVVHGLHKKFGVTSSGSTERNHHEPLDGLASHEDESSSTSDDSDDVSPSPAAHLALAREDLIITLTAAFESDNTMEAIAKANQERELKSYRPPKRTCKHKHTFLHRLSCRCRSGDRSGSSFKDEEDPKTSTRKVSPAIIKPGLTDLDGMMMSGALRAGDEGSDSDADTDSLPSTGALEDDRGHEVPPEDLSLLENVFGARAEDVTTLDVSTDMVSDSERIARRSKKSEKPGRAESVDLSMGDDGETCPQVTGQTSKTGATETMCKAGIQAVTRSNSLTPLSDQARHLAESRGVQTKSLPNKANKTSHMPTGKTKTALSENSNRPSSKRKTPPTSHGPDQSSKASRRKRARPSKEKRLRLARRTEEAAAAEKTLVD